MSAVRHSNRNATSTTITSRQPISSAVRKIPQRHLDECRGAEDRRIDLDVFQARSERLERGLDVARHVQRVAVRLFLDDQQQRPARR